MAAAVDILRSERERLKDRRDKLDAELTEITNDSMQHIQKISNLTADILNIKDALTTLGST